MNSKFNFTDIALISVGVTTILFIIAMIITFWRFQSTPDVLINNYFKVIFGEISVAGVLTCNKRRHNNNNNNINNVNDDEETIYKRGE